MTTWRASPCYPTSCVPDTDVTIASCQIRRPAEALKHLGALAEAGEEVTLILADQWMPHMSGVELLATAHRINRTAWRGLLIQWGDRSTTGPILRRRRSDTSTTTCLNRSTRLTSASIARSPNFSTSGGGCAGDGSDRCHRRYRGGGCAWRQPPHGPARRPARPARRPQRSSLLSRPWRQSSLVTATEQGR
jgi:hypothetical protein